MGMVKRLLISFALMLTTIAAGAQDAQSWHYTENADGTLTVVRYKHYHMHGNSEVNNYCHSYFGDVEVPSTIDGHTVTAIGENCFKDCDITSMKLPSTLRLINGDAFYGIDIEEIAIPASVDSIAYAFNYCSKLNKVVFEDGDKVLKLHGVRGNDSGVFCTGSQHVSVEEVYIGRDYTTWGGHSAFSGGSPLRKVTIGNQVTRLMDEAFYHCSNLTQATLGSGLTYIGKKAFCGCKSLLSLRIPDGVTYIGEEAFYGCDALESVNIPRSLKNILKDTFYGCKFEEITIPSDLDSIAFAFNYCTKLKKVVIEDGTKVLKLPGSPGNDSGVFCTGSQRTPIEEVYIGRDYTTWGNHCAFRGDSLKKVTVGNYVTRLNDEAFYNCRNLKQVTLGSGLTSIGRISFIGCKSLPSLSIPDGVAYIGEEAFSGCTSLERVNVPRSLKQIIRDTFRGCPIREVTIPASVDSIGDAFRGCSKLTKVTIEDGSEPIRMAGSYGNDWAIFSSSNCSALETVYVGRDMLVAGGSPFRNRNVKKLTLGRQVSNIIATDYTYCSGLTDFYCKAVNPPACESATVFRDINKKECKLYVPQVSLDAYKEAPVWQEFFNILTIASDIVGDTNGDNTVNAADIVELVNFIMGNPSKNFNESAGDLNGDGVLNAADIVLMVNIIMGS